MWLCRACTFSSPIDVGVCARCGGPLESDGESARDPLVGRVIAGEYRIDELVAEGGMGRIYRAEQQALGRSVAVKLVHPSLLGDQSVVGRFMNEARAASRLNHPNSVSVIAFGATEDGELYMVMEYLRGFDLARVLADEGPFSPVRAVDVARQVLAALAEAHHLGIVHRDVKPENVLLEQLRTRADFVKVVDFGIAQVRERDTAVDGNGMVFGTPECMAPEQAAGGTTDHRVDLYAVGVMLFRMLTGQRPFWDEDPRVIARMHLTEPVPDPRRVAPERSIPEPLVAVVMKALEKAPEDRYASADEMSQALERALAQIVASRRASTEPLRLRCAACGQELTLEHRFCNECGAPTRASGPGGTAAGSSPGVAARPRSPEPAEPEAPKLPLPLIGADDELGWLHAHRVRAGSLAPVRLVGVPGVGKSRLLLELTTAARAARDLVVEVTPDRWGLGVRDHGLRQAIAGLAGLPPDGGGPAAWDGATPEAVRGLREVFETGPCADADCARAVVEALRWAVGKAHAPRAKRRILLAIDDLHRMDGPSRATIAHLVPELAAGRLLVVATHTPSFEPGWPIPGEVRNLYGLASDFAHELLRRRIRRGRVGLTRDPPTEVMPLYLEQVIRFRAEGGDGPPSQLADLVALRIDRVPPSARRVLQALAVLGEHVAVDDLRALVPSEAGLDAELAMLVERAFVRRTPEGLAFTHPLLREVADAAIPGAVRRELYGRAFARSSAAGDPLEVRAHRALAAGLTVEPLPLLEELAERRLATGDLAAAIESLQQALELSRHASVEGQDDRAIELCCKLGRALRTAGDPSGADGALREALDRCSPRDARRTSILRALSDVAKDRGRAADSARYLEAAAAHGSYVGAPSASGPRSLAEELEGYLKGG
jgi:serine/threonine-protein kinase